MKWFAFDWDDENKEYKDMCEGMGPNLSVRNLELTRNPNGFGWVVRGILQNEEMPVESGYFAQAIDVPYGLIRFDIDCITEEDVPAILAKLADMANAKIKKKLKPKEVIEIPIKQRVGQR